MLDALRLELATRMLGWGEHLHSLSRSFYLERERLSLLVFFHGYSLAHTLRPLVVAKALRERGYSVELAGRGPHGVRVRQAGFVVHDVETLPQSRMDQYVARGEYAYYDMDWIDRCVRSERGLLQILRPALVIHEMKPTVSVSARLEGIDEVRVTQAYNQPGYPAPIRLMERFSTEAGPFAAYLAQHAAQLKPRRAFYLMADIPEFHPPGRDTPGFHYAGPLLEETPEPPRLAILDEGWDPDWPLVYLTCGSSGRPPEYLDELIRAVRGKPYRFLVTTAGRWTGTTAADNVRVVDFLPGEWVLRRARVLVGVVGIGSIYQALRCGVPIIGAPEHLDQEYHLNRVESLGLGIKLERREFGAGAILQAVQQVLAGPGRFSARLAPFAEYLGRWSGGAAAADLVDSHFRSGLAQYRVDSPYLMSEEDFAHYLDLSTPATLPRQTVHRLLRSGIRRGLPHQWRQDGVYFDLLDSWNWLYDREPRFFAADYWALEEKRQRFFVRENGRVHCRSAWQQYRAEYRFRLFPEGLERGGRVRVYLPYPSLRPGHQEGVRLLSCWPSAMSECWVPSMGFFYGHAVQLDARPGPWEFGYTCELGVREQGAAETRDQAVLTETERRRYLELEAGLAEQPEVLQFLGQLATASGTSDEERARAIYHALARGRRFRKTKDRAQTLTYCTVAVLSEAGGHCITLSRAFIALCRLQGIPAREASGALIGYPVGEGKYAATSWGESIFGHTWVEVYLEGKGWCPVEFHGIVIGESAMTEDNVADPRLRSLIQENMPRYEEYYFGHLDNQRLLCSNSVKSIPDVLLECPEEAVGGNKRWQMPPGLRFECHLEVECR
jgi:UDP:flavonoid glycosyltransferase YjiC (YdhE family)/transglutaminase-like putative cysteine protease